MAKLLLCDCAGTQSLDRAGISEATGLACSKVHTGLCTREIDLAAAALQEGDVIVACQQEAHTFEALAEELEVPAPLTVDIRDRAGWSDEGRAATPKIAALLAAATLNKQPEKTVDVVSEGLCLIVGADSVALPLAEALSETLSVTCLLPEPADVLPSPSRKFDVVAGRLRSATGSFGNFHVSIDAFQGAKPGGRGALGFSEPRDGATSQCDIIVDVSGGSPLFPAHEKRDGYLRADPGDPNAVGRLLLDASGLVGTFEKTLHVAVEPTLCAHSRAEQTGCTRCLDLCPTGAISPDGDHVAIDPMICAGCGACSAVCPSGAVSFDAPTVGDVFREIQVLASTYLEAGGTVPRLLVHDDGYGREMIGLSARLGRGLPADVLPLEMPSVGAFGHAEMLAALATGFGAVHVLLSPKSEREPLEQQVGISQAILEGLGWPTEAVGLLDLADPDALSDALYGKRPSVPVINPILPLGPQRDVARLAARALASDVEIPVPLPQGAPYGAVLVDTEACTLCLSCVGLCPSGALDDNADKPELRFKEDACLQCGICATICPEDAITLEPQMDLSEQALNLRVLHEEEPFACIECGALFGVKSTVDRIVEKLSGKHSMFTNSDNARLIQMCDDCRVKAQYHSEASPFKMGERPRPRTTDDYLDD